LDAYIEAHKRKINNLMNRDANEANTKSNLIEPLLLNLGWQINDIDEVERERTVLSGNFVDYALLLNGNPKIYVEAKRIRDNLTNFRDISKAVSYANDDGIPWCIITNGNLIHLYKPQESGDLTNKKVLEINLSENLNLEFLIYFTKESVARNELQTHFEKIIIVNEVIHKTNEFFEELPNELIELIKTKTPNLSLSQIKDAFDNISISFENILSNRDTPPIPGGEEIPTPDNIVKIKLPKARREGDIPSWKRYNLLDIPKKHRLFFPGYKIPFIIKTDIGELETWVTGDYAHAQEGDQNAGWYISKSMTKVYRNHPELKAGDIVTFTKENDGKYKLDFEIS
jgi:hypothetical protein